MQTHRIEVRVHFKDDSDEKQKMIHDACVEACRTILAVAMLVSDERNKPQAKYISEDYAKGEEIHDITLDPSGS
jgi:hypothetical protein